jgi:hypothetical protein
METDGLELDFLVTVSVRTRIEAAWRLGSTHGTQREVNHWLGGHAGAPAREEIAKAKRAGRYKGPVPKCRLSARDNRRQPSNSRLHPAAAISRVALIGSFSTLHSADRFASRGRQ